MSTLNISNSINRQPVDDYTEEKNSAKKPSASRRQPFGRLDVNSKSGPAKNEPLKTKSKRPSLLLSTSENTKSNEVISTKQREVQTEVTDPQPQKRTTSVPSFFRDSSFSGVFADEMEDMLTLKRANRVYDSEDESPTKRLRTTEDERDEIDEEQRPSVLDFRDRLVEDELEGFQLLDWLQ